MLLIADPVFHAAIQGEEDDEDEESSLHVVHFTFAIICPFTTPLPANSVTPDCMVLSAVGSACPAPPSRALIVTFPVPSVYITNIVLPAIALPIPNPTHW